MTCSSLVCTFFTAIHSLECLGRELDQVSKRCSFCRQHLRCFVRKNRGKLVDKRLWKRIKQLYADEIHERRIAGRCGSSNEHGASFSAELSDEGNDSSSDESDVGHKRGSSPEIGTRESAPTGGSPASVPRVQRESKPGEIRTEFEEMERRIMEDKQREDAENAQQTYHLLLSTAPAQARPFRLQFLPDYPPAPEELPSSASSTMTARAQGVSTPRVSAGPRGSASRRGRSHRSHVGRTLRPERTAMARWLAFGRHTSVEPPAKRPREGLQSDNEEDVVELD